MVSGNGLNNSMQSRALVCIKLLHIFKTEENTLKPILKTVDVVSITIPVKEAARHSLQAERTGCSLILQGGAVASSLVYSLVETAKANDVDIYLYLKYLLLKTPTNQTPEEELEKLCPWNPECQSAINKLFIEHQKAVFELN